MSFRLGYETIVAQDDGGIHITSIVNGRRTDWVHGRKRPIPVVSFEVRPEFFVTKAQYLGKTQET